ncbi:MAG: hypothetical protein AUH85_04960 [Chloroflexi bacterium 13_1_40CM_4_68_4]|nr:MAG: hypothetical protein AUH85_04960 [Chloroflexi bacterium 13_1_40CM_4_68_4]
MPVSRALRFFIGAFNTVTAAGLAAYTSAFPLAFIARSQLAFHVTTSWLAVLAALVATISIALDLAVFGWIAVGYLLWIALLGAGRFSRTGDGATPALAGAGTGRRGDHGRGDRHRAGSGFLA